MRNWPASSGFKRREVHAHLGDGSSGPDKVQAPFIRNEQNGNEQNGQEEQPGALDSVASSFLRTYLSRALEGSAQALAGFSLP